MRVNEIDLPGMLEKHFKAHEHRLIDKEEYRGMSVFVSEGGPFFSNKEEFPLGFYESAYTVQATGLLFYQPLVFEYLHDIKERSSDTRRLGRIKAAKEAARAHIDEYIKANAN